MNERRELEIKTGDILQERLEDHWILNCDPTTTKDTQAATDYDRWLIWNSRLLKNGGCPECTHFCSASSTKLLLYTICRFDNIPTSLIVAWVSWVIIITYFPKYTP